MNYLYTSPFTSRLDSESVHHQYLSHVVVALQTQPDTTLILCPSKPLKSEILTALSPYARAETPLKPTIMTLDEWVKAAIQPDFNEQPGLLPVCMAQHLAQHPMGRHIIGPSFTSDGFCQQMCRLYLDSRRYGFSSGVYTQHHVPKTARFIAELLVTFEQSYGAFQFDIVTLYQQLQAQFYEPMREAITGKTVFCYGFWDIPDYQKKALAALIYQAASCSFHVFYRENDPHYAASSSLVHWLKSTVKVRHIGSEKGRVEPPLLTWHQCYDLNQECRFVIAKIQEWINAGVAMTDIAVIVPSFQSYGPPLVSLSRQSGLNLNIPRREMLASSAPISVIRHCLQLQPGRSFKRDLITLFRHPFARHVQLDGTRYELDPGSIETALSGLPHVESFSECLAQLDRRQGSAGESNSKAHLLHQLVDWLSRWHARFHKTTSGTKAKEAVHEFVTTFQLDAQTDRLLEALTARAQAPGQTPAETRRHQEDLLNAQTLKTAMDQLDFMMQSLSQVLGTHGTFSPAQFARHLVTLASLQPVSRSEETASEPSVLVASKFDSILVERPFMIIMGGIEGEWPSSIKSSALANDAFKKSSGWPSQDTFYHWDRFLFHNAVSKAHNAACITQPLHTESGRTLASHFLLELEQSGRVVPIEEDISGRILTAQDRQLLDADHGTLHTEQYPEWVIARQSDDVGPSNHGRVTHPDILQTLTAVFEPKSTSATQLDTYQLCPQVTFFKTIMNCPEPPSEELDVDRLQWGIMMHDITETFYREITQRHLRFQAQGHAEAIKSALFTIAERAFSHYHDGSLMWEMKRPSLFGRGDEPGILEAMLEVEMSSSWPLSPSAFEVAFDWVLDLGKEVGPAVQLRGKIDQVLLNQSLNVSAVLDFKTGHMPTSADVQHLRSLQLPIYMLSLGHLPGLKTTQCVGGIMFQIKDAQHVEKRVVVTTKDAKHAIFDLSRKRPFIVDEAFFEEAKRHIVHLRSLFLSGYFSTALHPDLAHITPVVRSGKCRTCRYAQLCRYPHKTGAT